MCERHFPMYLPILKEARLFHFPYKAHEVMQAEMRKLDPVDMQYTFTLPYDTVAVEDESSCVVLWDREKNQMGLGELRGFIDCVRLDYDRDNFDDNEDAERMYEKVSKNPTHKYFVENKYCAVTAGYVNCVYFTTDNLITEGNLNHSFIANKKHLWGENYHLDEKSPKLPYTLADFLSGKVSEKDLRDSVPHAMDRTDILTSALRNAQTALNEIFLTRQPTRFIVEDTPKKAKTNGKLIPRSHQRPIYRILTVPEIRKIMKTENHPENRKSPISHIRSRHKRILRSERYAVDRQGKPREKKYFAYGPRKGDHYYDIIDIPATWVGPDEVEIGKRWIRVKFRG